MSLLTASRPLVVLLTLASPGPAASQRLPETPSFFVENVGQVNRSNVRLVGDSPHHTELLSNTGLEVQQGARSLVIQFKGTATTSHVSPAEPLGAMVSYIQGQDPSKWLIRYPAFGSAHYTDMWPEIDVTISSGGTRLALVYHVADIRQLDRIRVAMSTGVTVGRLGDLRVSQASGTYSLGRPVVRRHGETGDTGVFGRFVKLSRGDIGIETTARLEGNFDVTQYLTEEVSGETAPKSEFVPVGNLRGNLEVTVEQRLRPRTTSGVQAGSAVQSFIAAFSSESKQFVGGLYFGGSGTDRILSVETDSDDKIYIGGDTDSNDFPLTGADLVPGEGRQPFVARFSSMMDKLLFSQRVGRSGHGSVTAMALDTANTALVIVGDTTASDLPVPRSAFQPGKRGIQNLFVAKVDLASNVVKVLTYFGGDGVEHGSSVVIDETGDIVIGGGTTSTEFPLLMGNTDHVFVPDGRGFVARLNKDGRSLAFCTYLGSPQGATHANRTAFVKRLQLIGNRVRSEAVDDGQDAMARSATYFIDVDLRTGSVIQDAERSLP